MFLFLNTIFPTMPKWQVLYIYMNNKELHGKSYKLLSPVEKEGPKHYD